MATPRSELIELIDRASKAAGSQAAAARAAGIAPQKVSNWKNGIDEAPPEAVALLAHVAGLDATEWLARAACWRSEGTARGELLRQALGGAWRATGGAIASFFAVASIAPEMLFNVPRCIKR
jgi:transcriptional regulator with XRE-family HTH domain